MAAVSSTRVVCTAACTHVVGLWSSRLALLDLDPATLFGQPYPLAVDQALPSCLLLAFVATARVRLTLARRTNPSCELPLAYCRGAGQE